MLILAGLGNPGGRHERNRHNLGFMAVDAIADRFGFQNERARFLGVTRQGTIETPDGPANVLVLKPQTYMNESGQSVAQAMADLEAFFQHPGWDLGPDSFKREDSYAHLLRGHDDADLSDGSPSPGQEGRVAGVAEDADGE